MQLGFVSAILPDLSLEQVLRFAAQVGYDCVELMCWPVGRADRKYAGVTHVDVTQLSPAAADDIRGLCSKYGVSISALGYYPNPLSGDAAESAAAVEHLKRVIAAAPRLGLKNVNTFVGNDHRLPLEQNFARFRQVWPDIVQWAEQHDVRIGIENCPMLFSGDEWPGGKNLARSPVIWRRMFETIPSQHFGLNYDPSHMVLQMMDYTAPIYEFRERLFHTHAKDLKIDRRRLDELGTLATDVRPHYSRPKIPGLGDINWSQWISALTDVGYQGSVCVEVEDDAFAADLAARQRALEISHNVLRPLIGKR